MQILEIKYVDLLLNVKNLVSAGIEHKMYYQNCPEWHTHTVQHVKIWFFLFLYSGLKKFSGTFLIQQFGIFKVTISMVTVF